MPPHCCCGQKPAELFILTLMHTARSRFFWRVSPSPPREINYCTFVISKASREKGLFRRLRAAVFSNYIGILYIIVLYTPREYYLRVFSLLLQHILSAVINIARPALRAHAGLSFQASLKFKLDFEISTARRNPIYTHSYILQRGFCALCKYSRSFLRDRSQWKFVITFYIGHKQKKKKKKQQQQHSWEYQRKYASSSRPQ